MSQPARGPVLPVQRATSPLQKVLSRGTDGYGGHCDVCEANGQDVTVQAAWLWVGDHHCGVETGGVRTGEAQPDTSASGAAFLGGRAQPQRMTVQTITVVSDRISCRVVGNLVFVDCRVCTQGVRLATTPREHFVLGTRAFMRTHIACA